MCIVSILDLKSIFMSTKNLRRATKYLLLLFFILFSYTKNCRSHLFYINMQSSPYLIGNIILILYQLKLPASNDMGIPHCKISSVIITKPWRKAFQR